MLRILIIGVLLYLWITCALAQEGYWIHTPDGGLLYCQYVGAQMVCY